MGEPYSRHPAHGPEPRIDGRVHSVPVFGIVNAVISVVVLGVVAGFAVFVVVRLFRGSS